MKKGMMTLVRLDGGVELWLRTPVRSSQSDVPVFATMFISLILTTSILSRSSRRKVTTDWDRGSHGAQQNDFGRLLRDRRSREEFQRRGSRCTLKPGLAAYG